MSIKRYAHVGQSPPPFTVMHGRRAREKAKTERQSGSTYLCAQEASGVFTVISQEQKKKKSVFFVCVCVCVCFFHNPVYDFLVSQFSNKRYIG